MPDDLIVEEAPGVEATDDHAEQNVTVVVSQPAPEPESEHGDGYCCARCESMDVRIVALESAMAAWVAEMQEAEERAEEAAPAGVESAETETVIGEQAVEAPAASEEPPAAPITSERHAGFWV